MAQVEFLLLEEDHRHEVTDFAELMGGPMILVALLAKGVLFQDEDLLVNVHALFVLRLALEALCFGLEFGYLFRKRLHSNSIIENHRFECYSSM